jgi:two-component system CheB/CheR fusion protein
MKKKAAENEGENNSSKKAEKNISGRESAKKNFLIVGIGASAGGVRALKEFFQVVPKDSGIAYVVILHLSPDYDSKLAEVLQTSSQIPVRQVKNQRVEVKPNCIYVISPNKSLSMMDGHLATSEIKNYNERRAPVDIFFRTLAESVESRSVAVILSGTGANGSMGVKRLKEKGGVIFVQDPKEAEFSDMPRNSIATELVDDILPVAQIPAKIAAYKEKYEQAQSSSENGSSSGANEQALVEIFTQLRVRTGHDFTNYKRGTVLRRIDRRINVRELVGLPAYARYIKERQEESNLLLKDLLISVTNFFRDREAFEELEKEIIPKILEGKTAQDNVRVWVAGCATGEEAYSLAMMFAEQTMDKINMPGVQIFATDIDDEAIMTARDGLYTNSDVADVSPDRLRRFFNQEGDEFRIRREIREMVLFAAHNLLKDPPFSRLDLVTCRNLLIYLNLAAQKRVLETLHFALKPNGYLFLGMSESVDSKSDLFVPVKREQHIFQSRPVPTRLSYPVETASSFRFTEPVSLKSKATEADQIIERLSSAALHLQLLEYYAPPSVVINEEYEIIHTSENAGRFMQISGDPSLNLLKVIRPELRLELRTALYQAVQRKTDVQISELKVYFESGTEIINIIIRPISRPFDGASGLMLVIFEPFTSSEKSKDAKKEELPEQINQIEPIARQLEDELMWTKMQLRTTVEQYEIQTEELKAANEELQAMMEEAHSSNEELETSKEELQSVNEELTTVNQELKIKIEELSLSNDDFQNLMNSTNIGTMFLDRSFKIKLFTPNMRDIFSLLPTDIGRSFTDLSTKLEYPKLISDLETVLKTLLPVEHETRTIDGRVFMTRILPYRTTVDQISGIVLTFIDITERKKDEARLKESEENLRLLIESATDYAIFTVTPDNLVKTWNKGAERIFGFTEKEIIGKNGAILFTPEDRAKNVPEQELRTALKKGRAEDERWHLRKDGSRFFASGIMQPLSDPSAGFVKIARDMTTKIQAGQIQREKEMLQKLIGAQEDERRRIARDLHDELGQQLTALRLKLNSVRKQCEDDDLCLQIDETQAIAEHIDNGVDFLAWELRPAALDDLGLFPAIEKYVREWSHYTQVEAEILASTLKKARFLPEVETNLYRIVQEAFNNIHKHSRASRAEVQLEKRDDFIVLVVEDNGRGFNPEEKMNRSTGIGLIGMKERAVLIGGAFEIESAPGQGTTLYVRVPLSVMIKKGKKDV